MSWDHVLWAARRAGLADSTAHHVLLQISTHANAWGRAWPSVGTLAAEMSLSPSAVTRAIGRLEAAGVLGTVRRTGRPIEFVLPNPQRKAGGSSAHPTHPERVPPASGTRTPSAALPKGIEGIEGRAAPADPDGPAPLNIASALPDWMLERLNRQTGAGR